LGSCSLLALLSSTTKENHPETDTNKNTKKSLSRVFF